MTVPHDFFQNMKEQAPFLMITKSGAQGKGLSEAFILTDKMIGAILLTKVWNELPQAAIMCLRQISLIFRRQDDLHWNASQWKQPDQQVSRSESRPSTRARKHSSSPDWKEGRRYHSAHLPYIPCLALIPYSVGLLEDISNKWKTIKRLNWIGDVFYIPGIYSIILKLHLMQLILSTQGRIVAISPHSRWLARVCWSKSFRPSSWITTKEIIGGSILSSSPSSLQRRLS